MAKEVFGFRVIDNNWNQDDTGSCMFYVCKEDTLVPTHEDFLVGLPQIPYAEAIRFLIKNDITNVITFDPDSEIVASSPYAIENEEDFQACERDGAGTDSAIMR